MHKLQQLNYQVRYRVSYRIRRKGGTNKGRRELRININSKLIQDMKKKFGVTQIIMFKEHQQAIYTSMQLAISLAKQFYLYMVNDFYM